MRQKISTDEKLKPVPLTSISATPPKKRRRRNFIDGTLATLVRKMESALFAEELAKKHGFLQILDPRVKIVGLFALILDVTLSRNVFIILFIFVFAVGLALLSKSLFGN